MTIFAKDTVSGITAFTSVIAGLFGGKYLALKRVTFGATFINSINPVAIIAASVANPSAQILIENVIIEKAHLRTVETIRPSGLLFGNLDCASVKIINVTANYSLDLKDKPKNVIGGMSSSVKVTFTNFYLFEANQVGSPLVPYERTIITATST